MIAIPYIPFDDIFFLFSSESLIAALVLLPLFVQEVKEMCGGSGKGQERLLSEEE